MPSRPPTRCSTRTCHELATHQGRCDQHQRKAWENKSANTRALNGHQRKTFHDNVMAASNGTCNWCGAPATDADHIIAIGLGGSPTDWQHNGQALCDDCHALKTEADNAQMLRRRTGRTDGAH